MLDVHHLLQGSTEWWAEQLVLGLSAALQLKHRSADSSTSLQDLLAEKHFKQPHTKAARGYLLAGSRSEMLPSATQPICTLQNNRVFLFYCTVMLGQVFSCSISKKNICTYRKPSIFIIVIFQQGFFSLNLSVSHRCEFVCIYFFHRIPNHNFGVRLSITP